MKKIFYFIIISLFTTIFFSACELDGPDWYGISSNEVPAQVGNALRSMYPQAEAIEWEYRDGYYTAIFRSDGFMREAWFNKDAYWLLSVTDISYTALHHLIISYLETHGYTPSMLKECMEIERPYFVTTYQVASDTKEMLCTEAAYLIREAASLPDPYPIEIPLAIWEKLQQLYPQSLLIDAQFTDYWQLKIRTAENNICDLVMDEYGNLQE